MITIIKGNKKRPFDDYKKLEKNERKYGEFTLNFRIPEIYERKWSSFEVQNGVLKIVYERDIDEGSIKEKKKLERDIDEGITREKKKFDLEGLQK